MTAEPTCRSMTGTFKVVRFNWPQYLVAGVILAGALMSGMANLPLLLSDSLWGVCSLGLLWTVTSLAASWWVYDHSHVYGQLTSGLGDLGSWATVHAGFDDATATLRALLRRPPAAVVELAPRAGASLRRARRSTGHLPSRSSCSTVALATGSFDTIFVTFAAHEIRDLSAQRAMFAELYRALRCGGRLVITEHLRDLCNFAVYGPGTFHFQRAATWYRRSAEVGLLVESDLAITPFVHRMVWVR
jgi:SAM-dependent methyltransferase